MSNSPADGRAAACPLRYVRKVRPGHDQLAGAEAADMIADIKGARGRGNQMDFVFGVVMPFESEFLNLARL